MRFQQIAACPDLRGRLNGRGRCRLGAAPNGRLPVSALQYVADRFRPYADGRYRIPDYGGDYRAQWALCARLSDRQTPHVDLVSVWRLVRDETYAGCLSSRSAARPSAGRFRVLCTRAPAPGKRAVLRRLADAGDLDRIPASLATHTLMHLHKASLAEVFGQTEQ